MQGEQGTKNDFVDFFGTVPICRGSLVNYLVIREESIIPYCNLPNHQT